MAGWGWGGLYRVPTQLLGEVPTDSEAGPEAPARGLEWWSVGTGRGTAPRYHPAGPVGSETLPVPRTLRMRPPGQ